MARKSVHFVFWVQIVYDSARRLPGAHQPHSAFTALAHACEAKFVVLLIHQAVYAHGIACNGQGNKGFFRTVNPVAHFVRRIGRAMIKPLEGKAAGKWRDPANKGQIPFFHFRQSRKRLVIPLCGAFHACDNHLSAGKAEEALPQLSLQQPLPQAQRGSGKGRHLRKRFLKCRS